VYPTHPDILVHLSQQHRDDLLREAADARLAAQLPRRGRSTHDAFPPVVAPLNLLVGLARRPVHESA
jgi:hypothetical protein